MTYLCLVEFRNVELIADIEVIFEIHKGRYGILRVHKELVN